MREETLFKIFIAGTILLLASPFITLIPCWVSIDYNFDAIDAALSGNYALGETLHQSGSFWGSVADILLPVTYVACVIGGASIIVCSVVIFRLKKSVKT
jgi:hypothetical protein